MSATKKNTILVILIVVGYTIYSFFGGSSEYSLNFEEDSITIGATEEVGITLMYSDIESVDFLEVHPDWGTKIDGDESGKMQYGTYENSEWGRYNLYVNKKLDSCLVIKTADETVVFNVESNETTEELHRAFTEYWLAKR